MAKETEHRGICVRNFSCNPINGERRARHTARHPPGFILPPRRGPGSRSSAQGSDREQRDPAPVAWFMVYTTGTFLSCIGCTSHCANAPFGFPPTNARAREMYFMDGYTVYTGCVGITGAISEIEILRQPCAIGFISIKIANIF